MKQLAVWSECFIRALELHRPSMLHILQGFYQEMKQMRVRAQRLKTHTMGGGGGQPTDPYHMGEWGAGQPTAWDHI